MQQFIAMLLFCAMLTGLIPSSLAQTVHAAVFSAADQEKWYEVTAKINSSWYGHIAGEITLSNNSEETIQDWEIVFPWDAQIISMLGGNYESTETGYIITPTEYNRDLDAGVSVNINFVAEGENAVLEELATEGFFKKNRVHITDVIERENMPPEPSSESKPTVEAAPVMTVELTPESIISTNVPIQMLTLMPTATPTLVSTASPILKPIATTILESTVSPTRMPTSIPLPIISPTLDTTAAPTIIPTTGPTEEPAEDLYVYTDTNLTEDLTCKNLFLMGGTLTVKDCTITVQGDYIQNGKSYTLQNGTMDIQGNAHIVSGTLTAREQSVFRAKGMMDVTGSTLSFTNSELIVQKDFECNTTASNSFSNSSLQIAGNVITKKGQLDFSSGSRTEIGGDLIDTILCPNEGYLETGGNYSMCGSSRLVMINTADRLQIGGDFRTMSEVDHTNLLQRGRMGLYGNFYQYGNPYAFNSEKDLLVAFMGNNTHYYWFTNRFSSQFSIIYGEAEEMDWDQEIDPTISNAIYYGIRAGLLELADSPDEVIAAAAIGAAAGLGIALASATVPGTAVIAGITGIGFTIYTFYQDYLHISSMDGSYDQIREAAKLATIFLVTSLASGIGAKVGGTAGSTVSDKVHEISLAVEKEIKNSKIWESTCRWLKTNVVDNAKAFTDDVKNLLNKAVVNKVEEWLDNSRAQILYTYQNLTADDIYADLKNLVDEDVLNYLQKEHGAPDSEHIQLLRDVADSIEAAAGKIQDRQICLKEVKYINEALQEGVSQTKIHAMLKRIISTEELKFAEDDLVYGPSAGGELRNLSDRAGGRLLTDLEKPTGYDVLKFSFISMDKTVAKNSMIHFDLTYLKEVEGILNNAGRYKDTITAKELRYIHEHWSRFSKNVKFYYHEMEVLPPWEE